MCLLAKKLDAVNTVVFPLSAVLLSAVSVTPGKTGLRILNGKFQK